MRIDPQEHVKADMQTIEWLQDNIPPSRSFRRWSEQLPQAHDQFKEGVGMSVFLSWLVLDQRGVSDGDILQLCVGGRAILDREDFGEVSYQLIVSEAVDEGERGDVLMKYHFDRACPWPQNGHPLYHLQFGGSLCQKAEKLCRVPDSSPGFDCDKPRIMYPPMSLALVLHCSWLEFPTSETNKLRKEGVWLQNHVREDQKRLLEPFYERCLDTVQEDRIVFEEFYNSIPGGR